MNKKEYNERLSAVEKIPGAISRSELKYLFNAAKNSKGSILEIGSYQGLSTCALGLGSKAGNRQTVYAIDVLIPPEFVENVKHLGIEGIVKPIESPEEEVVGDWKTPLSLFFSDVHYGDAKGLSEIDRARLSKMMDNWIPHLEEGGVIALNNVSPSFGAIFRHKPLYGRPIPKAIGRKYILYSGLFRNCGLAGTILYGTKSTHISRIDKLNNRAVGTQIAFNTFLYKLYLLSQKIPIPLKNVIRKIFRIS